MLSQIIDGRQALSSCCAQDEHAKNQARRVIEDSEVKMEQKKEELESLEQDLDQAERALEEIRDSLKG